MPGCRISLRVCVFLARILHVVFMVFTATVSPFVLPNTPGARRYARSPGGGVQLQRGHEGVPRRAPRVQPGAVDLCAGVSSHQPLAAQHLHAEQQRVRHRVRQGTDGAVRLHLSR